MARKPKPGSPPRTKRAFQDRGDDPDQSSWGYEPWDEGLSAYVPVERQRQRAHKTAANLQRGGDILEPVSSKARSIATSFWGRAWCRHLERYSDYESRLPRGRSYLRNGCVIDLKVKTGQVTAKVQGSILYEVVCTISTLDQTRWEALKSRCQGSIDSLLGLMAGEFPDAVMTAVTDEDEGLFPLPGELKLSCTCPDWADLCKHAAAALYGIGVRFDKKPELLFVLRGVDHRELLETQHSHALVEPESSDNTLADVDLGALFGIDLDEDN